MPQSNWNPHVFNRNSPRLRVNLCIRYYSLSRSSPCAALALENSFERGIVAQAFRVARPQQQHFQEQWAKSDGRAQCKNRPREVKQSA
jgi:hypothetical protein